MAKKDKTETGSNIVRLADAKKAREEQEILARVQEAPMEASPPQAIKFDGEDAWYIVGCDGEQAYLWIAYRKRKNAKRYTIAEVYPGLLKPVTALREVEDAADLMLEPEGKTQGVETIGDVLEDIEEVLFEDLIFDDAEGDD